MVLKSNTSLGGVPWINKNLRSISSCWLPAEISKVSLNNGK
ncbi:MAG: Uncharacterised protein [Crocinitomicaceae bacterium]|nr:MAG: Uncharacterised protein [Crocinitomicaceae bacterium]